MSAEYNDGKYYIYSDYANDHTSHVAGHTSSADGVNGFYEAEHQAPVDQRTTPTGTFGSYDHSFIPYDPTYEIHTPEQNAFGDRSAARRVVRWANNIARGKDDRRKTWITAEFVEGGTIGPAPRGR